MADTAEVARRARQASYYSQHNGVYVRIIAGDDEGFLGEDDDSGEQYRIEHSEVDLAMDKFYKLVLVE